MNVSSNGRLEFVCVNEPSGYGTQSLPAPPLECPFDYTIFPLWQDMRTDAGLACSTWANGCGVFTSVSGAAPNRIFNIEWHAVLSFAVNSAQNFEVRLYENDPNQKFEVILGALNTAGHTEGYVSGVQGNSGAGFFTQDFCGLDASAERFARLHPARLRESNTDAYCYANRYSHSPGYTNRYCNFNAYSDFHAQSDAYAEA